MTSKVPESSASALTPEDGSISGTTDAMATPDIPIASKNIPNAFTYTSSCDLLFLRSPSVSRRVPALKMATVVGITQFDCQKRSEANVLVSNRLKQFTVLNPTNFLNVQKYSALCNCVVPNRNWPGGAELKSDALLSWHHP